MYPVIVLTLCEKMDRFVMVKLRIFCVNKLQRFSPVAKFFAQKLLKISYLLFANVGKKHIFIISYLGDYFYYIPSINMDFLE
jgi:hypothetical protein